VFRVVDVVWVFVAVLSIVLSRCFGDGVDDFARNSGLSSRDVVLEGSSRFGSQKAKAGPTTNVSDGLSVEQQTGLANEARAAPSRHMGCCAEDIGPLAVMSLSMMEAVSR